MARYRTIKPEFWTSEQIVECSPMARLLFIGLWNFCDDRGVHPYSVKRIKMEVFPADAIDLAPLLGELLASKLLQTFEADGETFLYVTGWHHQKIERPTYRFPPPPTDGVAPSENRRTVGDASANDRRAFGERAEGSGAESSGVESRRAERNERSGVESRRNERESRGARRSLVEISPETKKALASVNWDEVARCAGYIHSRVPAKSKEDALAWCRFAVLLQTTFAEAWLMDALESVKLQKPAKPQAYLTETLKSKAAEQGVDDLVGLMKHIRIRDDILKEIWDE